MKALGSTMTKINTLPRLDFDPELEAKYDAHATHRGIKLVRVSFLVFVAFHALFSVTDITLVAQWSSLLFALRFFVVFPAFTLAVILTFHPEYHKWEQSVLLVGFIIGGASVAIMLVLEPLNIAFYGGLFLVLSAGYFMLHLKANHAITGGLIILATFVAGVVWRGGMSPAVFAATVFLIVANIMGGVGAYQIERLRRNDFLQLHRSNQTQAESRNTLIERNTYLEAILQTSADGFLVVDGEGKVVQANDAYCRMSGYSEHESRWLTIDDIDAGNTPEEKEARDRQIIEKGNGVFETRHRRKDGSVFDVEVSTTFLSFPNTAGTQFVCFCRDITTRKQEQERTKALLARKELLLKEAHHRIKNDLSTVSSLLSLQSQFASPDVRTSLEAARNRVNAMFVLYEKMLISDRYDAISCKNYLDAIVETLESLFSDRVNVTIEKRIDDFDLTTRKLFPLGIIVNEIVTNTMKHAFNGRRTGQIGITLDRTENYATLSIQDDGVGLPDGFDASASKGFGLTVVTVLAQQLGGTLTIENDAGTRSVLAFRV